jgi:penicillin-binding protein 1A
MARDLTMALGSSALTPIELATAYTVFASGGVRVSPTYITRVTDRDGHILESVDPVDFPQGPRPGQRLIPQAAERVISAETAYLVTNLMESVVRDGTGARAKTLGRPVAGKTGTTNDLKDAWFAGFVPQLVAVSWIGYDQERPLGKGETGSRAALPAWLSFMQEAVKEMVPLDFPVPDSIEFRPIDPETGLLAPEDSAQAYIEAFAPGTAPIRYALDAKPAGHVNGAKQLPSDQILNAGETFKRFKVKPVIVYDESGSLSAAAVRQLQLQGFNKAFSLRGGFAGWRAENLPVAKAA